MMDKKDYSMSNQTLAYAQALVDGWTVERVTLYDEEGVEGWRWISPCGDEYTEVGGWEDLPTIPEAVMVKLLGYSVP